jgi:hypothetical protein
LATYWHGTGDIQVCIEFDGGGGVGRSRRLPFPAPNPSTPTPAGRLVCWTRPKRGVGEGIGAALISLASNGEDDASFCNNNVACSQSGTCVCVSTLVPGKNLSSFGSIVVWVYRRLGLLSFRSIVVWVYCPLVYCRLGLLSFGFIVIWLVCGTRFISLCYDHQPRL